MLIRAPTGVFQGPSPGPTIGSRSVTPAYRGSNDASQREPNRATPKRALVQGQAQAESQGGADQQADPQRFVHYLSGCRQ